MAEIVLLASRCVVLANVASGAVDNDGDRLVLVLNQDNWFTNWRHLPVAFVLIAVIIIMLTLQLWGGWQLSIANICFQ